MPSHNLRELHWPNLLTNISDESTSDPEALRKHGKTKLITIDGNTINIQYIALVSENGKMKLYEYEDNDSKDLLQELPRLRGTK